MKISLIFTFITYLLQQTMADSTKANFANATHWLSDQLNALGNKLNKMSAKEAGIFGLGCLGKSHVCSSELEKLAFLKHKSMQTNPLSPIQWPS